jgi:hypothetical protein
MNNGEVSNNEESKRPEFLSILCVLTFIGSGLAAFSNLVIYFSFDMLMLTYSNGELNLPGSDIIFAFSKSFYIFGFLIYLASFSGALLMWRLRKEGFHLYSISQILLLILPTLYVKTDQVPLFGILLTSIFILFYYRHLKYMH